MNFRPFILIILLGLFSAACGSGSGGSAVQTTPPAGSSDNNGGSASDDQGSVDLTHKTFIASTDALLNPERGLYKWTDLLEDDYSGLRSEGYTLAYVRVMLKNYLAAPLDAAFIAQINQGFGKLRNAGVKAVLRFVYSDSEEVVTDAPLNIILQHISQLKDVLNQNADVIYVMQAGFIGRWGEWHSSTNGLDTDAPSRKAVLDAILNVLPASRDIQVRTPMFKDSYVSLGGSGDRIGHHNDCFLASDTDEGTYPHEAIDVWKDYVAKDGLLLPVGGETCAVNPPRSDCTTALAELNQLHYSFLSGSYSPDVLANWQAQGCLDEIKSRLGYRFSLTDAWFNDHVKPGDVLHVKLAIKNDGFAPLYDPRDVYLLLEGSSSYIVKLDVVPSLWAAGSSVTVEENIGLPNLVAEGKYSLSIWMPDRASTLAGNPLYDIEFANASGNLITDSITVDSTAKPYAVETNLFFEPK